MQWLWYFSELPLLATAVALWLYKPDPPVESKEDLRAILMHAREFLVQIDWFEDPTPRDHQALMMLRACFINRFGLKLETFGRGGLVDFLFA